MCAVLRPRQSEGQTERKKDRNSHRRERDTRAGAVITLCKAPSLPTWSCTHTEHQVHVIASANQTCPQPRRLPALPSTSRCIWTASQAQRRPNVQTQDGGWHRPSTAETGALQTPVFYKHQCSEVVKVVTNHPESVTWVFRHSRQS